MARTARFVLALLLLAPAASAGERFKLLLNGSYNTGSFDFAVSRSFTEFAETATNSGSFSVASAAGFDVGLQFNILKHVGVMASVTRFDRDETGRYEASLPHPLYLGEPRRVEGELPATSYTETAGHFDIVLAGSAGKMDLSAWAGVTLFRVEASLLTGVQYRHAYPYDEVTITGTPAAKAKDEPMGFNLGAGADFRLTKHVALGAQVRFSQAKATFEAGGVATGELDIGGFQAGGGVRFIF